MDRQVLLQFLGADLGIETEDIEDSTLLFSTGVVDSFALVELVAYIEGECGVRVNAMDLNLDNFDSVERILAYVERERAVA